MKRAIVLFVTSILILTFSQSAYCKNVDPKKQAIKLITAIQNDDFETVFGMSFRYVLDAKEIEAQTPAFLFQKKLREYYENSREEFYKNNSLAKYLPKNCNWKIIEVKKTKMHGADVYLVYVSVSYVDLASSPEIKLSSLPEIYSPLKEGVVELSFSSINGLFVIHRLISDANVLWSLPLRIYGAKYGYGISNKNPALAISFSIDGGNPKWAGGKTPYKYNVIINDTDIDSFVSKYSRYSHYIEDSPDVLKYSQKTFILVLDDQDSFRWPKGFASPVNIKIQVTDSSNPVKSDSCELKIEALAASEESVQDKAQGAVNKLKGIIGF